MSHTHEPCSYRHSFGLAPGAEEYEADERFLAGLPTVDVPAIVLAPTEDPAPARRSREQHRDRFPDLLGYRQIASGHNQPYDAPRDVAPAVRDDVANDGARACSLWTIAAQATSSPR